MTIERKSEQKKGGLFILMGIGIGPLRYIL